MPLILAIIVSLLVILAAPVRALAQDAAGTPVPTADTNQFKVAPEPGADPGTTEQGYFVYQLTPGAEASGRVRVINPGDEPVTIAFAAVDAKTAQRGGSAFADAEVTREAAGAWVDLEAAQVSVEPGDEVSVGFTVRPPEGIGPGQYLAGLAAFVSAEDEKVADAGESEVGAAVAIRTRYVIGVQVDVPGEWTPSMTITGASVLERPSGAKLGIALHNNGDAFLKPQGSVTLTDAAGSEILNQPIEMGTFLTGTEVIYPVAWPGVPVGGEYGVEVELNYADDEVARYGGVLAISEDIVIAAPEPEEVEPAETAVQAASVPAPVAAPAAPMPRTSWNPYLIAGVLSPIVILLVVVLLRTRQPRW